jgi:hypothetical protein
MFKRRDWKYFNKDGGDSSGDSDSDPDNDGKGWHFCHGTFILQSSTHTSIDRHPTQYDPPRRIPISHTPRECAQPWHNPRRAA